jgi:hypothetical protein
MALAIFQSRARDDRYLFSKSLLIFTKNLNHCLAVAVAVAVACDLVHRSVEKYCV